MTDSQRSAMATSFGIVIIGRNEGARLRLSLDSVAVFGVPVVYVDSGSTDGSVQEAAGRGIQVVELSPDRPFSAARARNEGFSALRDKFSKCEFVQFLDGDCELLPEWPARALEALMNDDRQGFVFGHLSERHPSASPYNRLCAMEWKSSAGRVSNFGAIGGIMMVRASLFHELRGFREDVIAGEEPEFAVRLTAQGFHVTKLAVAMATHDANILRFSQWWRRAVRSGHAIGQRYSLNGDSAARDCARERRSVLFWGCILPIFIGIAVITISPYCALLLSGYGVLWYRIFAYRLKLGETKGDARFYAGFILLAKFAEAFGLWKFAMSKAAGQYRIIEYK